MPSYRNISLALVGSVRDVLRDGTDVLVRQRPTRELVARNTRIEAPLERYLSVPDRNNDIVAQFAESMWVLAGRDDIAWLTKYLPRAPQFSDDGAVWRGAYGPRLRNWQGVDQIDAVRRLLLGDRSSRQAVMSIFDPARDFAPSKDIPCNNWLAWIIRDDRLHMSAALRSNDVWWGFSGVNAFEWSMLHEMLAFWVGAEVGRADYYAMSFHLYSDHFARAERAAVGFHGLSPYDFGIKRAEFTTPWESFSRAVERWFQLEAQISAEPTAEIGSFGVVGDPLLDSGLTLIHVSSGHVSWGAERLADTLAGLPAADWVVALYDRLAPRYPGLLDAVPQSPIADFFAARMRGSSDKVDGVRAAIKRLHTIKDRAYGGAWKKRGEQVSILPNIARKIDRLHTLVQTGAGLEGESALDTTIDLVVYVEKYRLYLAQQLPPGALLPLDALGVIEGEEASFGYLIDKIDLAPLARPLTETVADLNTSFDACWKGAENDEPVETRLLRANALSGYAAELLALLVHGDGQTLSAFLRTWSPV
jgi:thymidylate synthase